ncbi:MAG: aldehyde:ferredoxin oxidoreductase [Desulfarculus sp.]|jgi:aldehyde:ferredoxin oxidoreductase|nr:MAG: aldehyde:ferredoxin oxidoreductase [Desulfarculus sp.]
MHGFYNKLLSIDAGSRGHVVLPLGEELLARTLGGKGLAARLLLEHNPPGVDPYDPENRLIIAAGPVAGTGIWGSCRHGVFTKSPQTGLFSESYSGGTAAEPIAAAGYDAVMISGVSDQPVWLEITPAGVEFHDASALWGLDCYETEDAVKEWLQANRPQAKRSAALVVGPAGENRVAFAVIENDYWRSAGRTGVGAVLGRKRIKAVAFWGQAAKSLAHPEMVKAFAKEVAAKGKDDAGVKAYKTKGTPMMVDVMSHVGSFPARYWQEGTVAHREQINADALHGRCQVTPHACLKCFIACGRLSTVKQGRHAGLKIEGPEYETIYAFGGLCEVETIEEIAYLNDLCDRLGMDTISAGNLAALAIEAVRQGKVDYDIDYGQVDKIAGLLNDIAQRRGLGDILALGIKAAAAELGMADQAIHVKGLEPAGYDPRVLKGMGLAYGTSPRGACHLRATFYKPELSGMVDPETIPGKAAVFVQWEDRLTFFDTLILCRFYRDLYQWEDLGRMVQAVTGLELSSGQMQALAKRVLDDTRRFNLREGLTVADDRLPKRFTSEALPETGKAISAEQMEVMLSEYYQARGWDAEGRPPEA